MPPSEYGAVLYFACNIVVQQYKYLVYKAMC
jgi:hypothetical protein